MRIVPTIYKIIFFIPTSTTAKDDLKALWRQWSFEKTGLIHYSCLLAPSTLLRKHHTINIENPMCLANRVNQGKRVFIKDMIYYLMPPNGGNASIAPSLRGGKDGEKPVINSHTNGVTVNGHSHVNGVNGHTNGVNGTNATNGVVNGIRDRDNNKKVSNNKDPGSDGTGNPTVIPLDILKKFHWTFLIRHPRRGIPSYVRCCSPPLSETTGWDHFMPSEAGYLELRRLFEYLREQGLVGPSVAGDANNNNNNSATSPLKKENNGEHDEVSITVLDADDLLDHPKEAVSAFCRETGIPFSEDMLKWDDEENQKIVAEAFAKWKGFHNDAINSKGLTARTHPKVWFYPHPLFLPPLPLLPLIKLEAGFVGKFDMKLIIVLVFRHRKLSPRNLKTRNGGRSTARKVRGSSGLAWMRILHTTST